MMSSKIPGMRPTIPQVHPLHRNSADCDRSRSETGPSPQSLWPFTVMTAAPMNELFQFTTAFESDGQCSLHLLGKSSRDNSMHLSPVE